MAHVFTKRNHYNPCFWTSLWNTEYFEAWARTGKPEAEPREQLVFALSLRSERIYRTKVSNLFYEKNLGVAKITPESMKTFCQRWHPQEYERLCAFLAENPETIYLDFEQILAAIERLDTYSWLLKAAKVGGIESAEHNGFCFAPSLSMQCVVMSSWQACSRAPAL